MSYYHIVIQTERRVSTPETPRQLSIPISATVQQGEEYVAGPQQLHTHSDADLRIHTEEETLPPDFSNPQFVMVAEWDGISPYVIMHKGDYAARNMEYSGWPSITKEQYDEQVAEISDSNLSSI